MPYLGPHEDQSSADCPPTCDKDDGLCQRGFDGPGTHEDAPSAGAFVGNTKGLHARLLNFTQPPWLILRLCCPPVPSPAYSRAFQLQCGGFPRIPGAVSAPRGIKEAAQCKMRHSRNYGVQFNQIKIFQANWTCSQCPMIEQTERCGEGQWSPTCFPSLGLKSAACLFIFSSCFTCSKCSLRDAFALP